MWTEQDLCHKTENKLIFLYIDDEIKSLHFFRICIKNKNLTLKVLLLILSHLYCIIL